MSKIKLIDLTGKSTGDVEVAKSLIVDHPSNQAIFDAVMIATSGPRQGTHSTLTKGEVRGGGKKPYAQKHTGNARQGSIRNPHYVGGGVAFGPKPNRNYLTKVNDRVSKLALASVFYSKIKTDAVSALVDATSVKKPNTKSIALLLKTLKLNGKKVLFVLNNEKMESLIKSAQNINRVIAKKANQTSIIDLMHANHIIIQEDALKYLAKVVA
jgi:large subunit ribosomal protein L4